MTTNSKITVWEPTTKTKLKTIPYDLLINDYNPQGGAEILSAGESLNFFMSSPEDNSIEVLKLL